MTRTPLAPSAANIAAIVAAMLAAGCATSPEFEALREAPSFQVGYGDGCLTSGEEHKSFSTKSKRDSYAFDNDEAYRAGWRQGYLECDSRLPSRNNGGRVLGERSEYNN
ncbi:MAG: hypothetical protein ACX939_09100 [Hyphococcus sp.]